MTLTLLRQEDTVATPPLPNETSTQTQSIAFTLRINGPEDSADLSTRLALCYVAVMQVLALAHPDRIHWGYTNVIHTTASFLLESSGRHMKPNAAPGWRGARKSGATLVNDLVGTAGRAKHPTAVGFKTPICQHAAQPEGVVARSCSKQSMALPYGFSKHYAQGPLRIGA